MSNNLEELVPAGDFNIYSVFNFFNIAAENRELLKSALLDIAGLYTTIAWNTDKYITINLLKKRNKRGISIYNVNNTKSKSNNKQKIIIEYDPYNNVNSNSNSNDLELLLRNSMKLNNDNNHTLHKLIELFNKQISEDKKIGLIEKYDLHHLFLKPKEYKLNNQSLQFAKGPIVKSQTTGTSFELLEPPLYRTLKLASMKPRKIYIYKKTTENVYYIYSNWGAIANYTGVFETKLIQYLIEYIRYIILKYSIVVGDSKFIFAGHSEGANVSQNLVVGILKNGLIPKQNLFLISLSYPQSLTQDDLQYLYDNLDGQFISLVAMGYLEDRDSNNVNAKITKKNIKNNKVLVNNYTKIYENKNNNLKLLKSLCIFFDYNKDKYIPKAIYNLDDYMKIIKNKSTYGSFGSNNHSLRQKIAHKFHNFTDFIKFAIISLIPK